ncbi:MAG: GPR endopeptidase [Clostridia bacterium]|nr:GPR endopeptidase [Clostridia bacterium]
MNQFLRSDLAVEYAVQEPERGVRVTEGEVEGFRLCRVQIKTPEAAAAWGRPEGHYVTVEGKMLTHLDGAGFEGLCRILGVELRSMAERLWGRRLTADFSVLTVGLGNRRATPDAIGPETVARLSVTRHLERMDGALFSTVGLCRLSAIEPGVPATTGLETVETVRGLVAQTHPDLVLAVDALTARSLDRLGRTVQLSDGGIRPASGTGRGHCALDRESLGVPVISLGIPTAVAGETLLGDLLGETGVDDPETLNRALKRLQGHTVTVADVDLLVQTSGALLAHAIERAFSVS